MILLSLLWIQRVIHQTFDHVCNCLALCYKDFVCFTKEEKCRGIDQWKWKDMATSFIFHSLSLGIAILFLIWRRIYPSVRYDFATVPWRLLCLHWTCRDQGLLSSFLLSKHFSLEIGIPPSLFQQYELMTIFWCFLLSM